MAIAAKRDQENRVVEVNRLELLETLRSNREKHIAEYEEAMSGYKDLLVSNIDSAFEKAKAQLDKSHAKTRQEVLEFTDEDIKKQSDYFTIVEGSSVHMKVPRSFAKEYDAAIDMATWDVRETLELTHAEFTCFVRDEWDWKSDFAEISTRYIGKKL